MLIMNDQQLNIRIKLNQISQLPEEPESPEETVDQVKPPFDWRKISAAALLLAVILGGTLYGWLAEENSTPIVEALSENTHAVHNDGLIPGKEVESGDISVNNDNATAKVLATTAGTPPLVKPTPKPIIEATTNLGHNIIPPNKPAAAKYKTLNQTTKEKPAFTDRSHVVKAQLTSAIQQREPTDNIDHVWLDREASQPIYFFLHLRGLEGKEANISWFYQDKEIAKIPFIISNDNWRTNSSKMLSKRQLGQWRVEVHDQSGKLLVKRFFTVSHRSE
jgi:hypothetical protein